MINPRDLVITFRAPTGHQFSAHRAPGNLGYIVVHVGYLVVHTGYPVMQLEVSTNFGYLPR